MNSAAHIVQYFHSDEPLIAAVSRYIFQGLNAADTCVVCATRENLDLIEAQLFRLGVNPMTAAAEYRYITLDAERTLASFYDEEAGNIDHMRFHQNIDQLIRQAAARGQPVRIYGEMVDLLMARSRPDLAVELEEMWNEVSRQHNFSMFCTYHVCAFTEDNHYRQLLRGAHSHVLFDEA